MGWFSGLFKSAEKGAVKDLEKEAVKAGEQAVAKGIEKDVAKNVEKGVGQGFSAGTMIAVASLPIVGGVITAMMTADTAKEAFDDLLDNPTALVIIGGVAFLILRK
jgi:cytochrome c biogenesis protein CcdA